MGTAHWSPGDDGVGEGRDEAPDTQHARVPHKGGHEQVPFRGGGAAGGNLRVRLQPRFPATHVSQARLEGVQGHCGGGESSSPRSFSIAQLKLEGLPDAVTDEMLKSDESFLRTFHHILLEVEVEEGALICPETGRQFTISKGIPNLLLNEDEC